MSRAVLSLVCGWLCAGSADMIWAGPTEYVVYPNQTYQTMDNFGANDAWSLEHVGQWAQTNRARVADLLFSTNQGIGLSCWRFYLGAGANDYNIRDPWRAGDTFETTPGHYDWSRLAGERWFLRAARARGVRQFAMSVYSPPTRLTRNGLTNLGEDRKSATNLKPGAEEDYARYLTDILVHFRDNPDASDRMEFNWILPVNEPQWAWQSGQEGNRMDNAELLRVYRALRRQMDAAGLHTQILGPESGDLPDMVQLDPKAKEYWGTEYGDYLHLFCDAPDAAHLFDHRITYHSYWSDDVGRQLIPDREALHRAFLRYPGWKIWQSEYCIMEPGRDLGMNSALRVARVIHYDLTVVNASSWQWWSAVANEDYKSGLLYTEYHHPGDQETVQSAKIFWALGNYSRFIRPGMQRIEISGPQDKAGLLTSAYRDPHTGRLVLVLVNEGATDCPVQVQFAPDGDRTASGSRMQAYITSADRDLEPAPEVSGGRVQVPARAVMTLVGTDGGWAPVVAADRRAGGRQSIP